MFLEVPNILFNHFPDLSEQKLAQFERLRQLIFSWNEKINLVSRKDIEHLTERHILHSLAIAKAIQFKPGTKILDIGTGGGFPGVPLAIMFPLVQFHLADSIGKKINVVNDIITNLDLKNAVARQKRVEELEGPFDFAVSRGVASLQEMLFWMKGKFAKKNFNSLANGLLCLKGGDLTEEIKAVKNRIVVYNIADFFVEPSLKQKKLSLQKMPGIETFLIVT